MTNEQILKDWKSHVKEFGEQHDANFLHALNMARDDEGKSFGDCRSCYGKGYSTTIEYASGRGESDIGQRNISIHYQLPLMRFCICARGKQLKEILGKVVKEY